MARWQSHLAPDRRRSPLRSRLRATAHRFIDFMDLPRRGDREVRPADTPLPTYAAFCGPVWGMRGFGTDQRRGNIGRARLSPFAAATPATSRICRARARTSADPPLPSTRPMPWAWPMMPGRRRRTGRRARHGDPLLLTARDAGCGSDVADRHVLPIGERCGCSPAGQDARRAGVDAVRRQSAFMPRSPCPLVGATPLFVVARRSAQS